jgi:hypothetical protein
MGGRREMFAGRLRELDDGGEREFVAGRDKVAGGEYEQTGVQEGERERDMIQYISGILILALLFNPMAHIYSHVLI